MNSSTALNRRYAASMESDGAGLTAVCANAVDPTATCKSINARTKVGLAISLVPRQGVGATSGESASYAVGNNAAISPTCRANRRWLLPADRKGNEGVAQPLNLQWVLRIGDRFLTDVFAGADDVPVSLV